jgi:hypothetical protein
VDPIRARFPFVQLLEDNVATFLDEVVHLPTTGWVDMRAADAYAGQWRAFPLALGKWAHEFPGVDLARNRAACPGTARVLDGIEGLVLGGYLSLEAGSELRAHTDFRDDDVIRAHVALQLPEDEARAWRIGTARLLDVRKPHAARNPGPGPRRTLIIDVRMPFPIGDDEVPPWNP